MEFALPEPVLEALNRLKQAGFAAYVVGGCVRDHVLGMVPHDYDICTAARPEDMKKVFFGERTIETGIRHGTLTVVLSGMPLEITTFRVDGEYLDGRHPASVRFAGKVEEDLSRRDFTINAMAYTPDTGIVDPFGGREDCRNGIVRCVGEAEKRFEEDALRILRALRFSARLGFPIEENTALAARRDKENLKKISRERIAAELTGTLLGSHAPEVLGAFPEILCAAVPELTELTQGSRWTHALRTLSCIESDTVLRWAALLLDAAANDRPDLPYEVLNGLKMPCKLMESVRRLTFQGKLNRYNSRPSVHYLLMHMGPEGTNQLLKLMEADRLAMRPASAEGTIREEYALLQNELKRLLDENACYSLAQLAVNGKDMAAAGLRGPRIGQTLNHLLTRVAMDELPNEREALLNAVKEQSGI
ncbi:MAG: hypothetical protein IKN04_17090 [Clostridia bacterium]|nr:hypothetical protein [Clostridia bacterium]